MNLIFIYKLGHVNSVTSSIGAMETQQVFLLHCCTTCHHKKILLWCFYVTGNDEFL